MKSFRTFAAVLFVLASFTLSFAAFPKPTTDASGSTIASTAPSIPTRLNDGPAPIPLCPPDVDVCDSLPLPQIKISFTV